MLHPSPRSTLFPYTTLFRSEEKKLVHELRQEYPQAEISPGGQPFSAWVQAIVRHLEGKQPRLDLPLDVQATAFQRRVRSEEHTSELQSRGHLVCRLLLEKKK